MTALTGLMTRYLRRANARALRFDPVSLPDLPQPRPGHRYLLYIHVPFCESLCPFCSFHRVLYSERRAQGYFDSLRREIGHYARLGFEFGEVYVGGGTPTVQPRALASLLQGLRDEFQVADISVETNPNHLVPEVLDPLQAAGVSRLSVGVQSFDDRLLQRMGRLEAYGNGDALVGRLQTTAGRFRTLNVDMIFNLPLQDEASLGRDLDILVDELSVDQLSFYPLMASPATRQRMDREMGEVSFSREQDYYLKIRERLASRYAPSSAWCFSRAAGMVDEYVVDQEDYLGIGSGAFGYLDGCLTANTFSIRGYQQQVAAGGLGLSRARHFSRREQLRYHLLMRLFGLRLEKAMTRERFGPGALRELWPEITGLKLIGALRDETTSLALTERGMYYWVVMMREFFSGVNRFRDEMRAQGRAT